MKLLSYLLFCCFCFGIVQAQVGIGTTSPDAQLDIKSSNQGTPSNTDGLLIPKIDEYPITNPTVTQDGMMVFVTGTGTPTKGFYYWDQGTTSWIPFTGTTEWADMGDYLTPSDGFSEDITIGGTDNATARLTVRSDKAIAGLFTNTSVQNGWDIGVNSYLNNNSASATSFTVGNYNDVINEGLGNLYGDYNRVRGDGSAVHTGELNNLSGSSSGAQYGNYQIISNSGNGDHYGNRNFLSGTGSGQHYGVFTQLLGAGDGDQTGVSTAISNSGNGTHYGIANNLNGDGSGGRVGVRNDLNGSGDGNRQGVINFFGGLGTGSKTGILSFLSGASSGLQLGSQSFIDNTGDGNHYGAYNTLNGTGSGEHYGVANYLDGSGTGSQYGVLNQLVNDLSLNLRGTTNNIYSTSNGGHIGTDNQIIGGGSGPQYAVNNFIDTNGSGIQVGTNNGIFGSGTGISMGTQNIISGVGNGDKYGSYNRINTTTGGTHYGIYSEALKVGSYAGYFLGRVDIGTDVFNTYALPASRGTNGQIMQTDGSGNVSWANPISVNTSPAWNINGTTNDATDVNQDMFRYGKVAIGTNVNSYPLQILSNDERYAFFSFASNAEANNPKDNAHFEISSNANNNVIQGISNVVSGAGTLQYLTGQYNNVVNSTAGYSVGNTNFIQANGNGPAEGVYNSLALSGSGNSNAIRNEITGAGSGIIYGITTAISNTGAGQHIGLDTNISGNGDGLKVGNNVQITGTGDGNRFGNKVQLTASGSGTLTGTQNEIIGGNFNTKTGTKNIINATAESIHVGTNNQLLGAGTGPQYGTQTSIAVTASNTAQHFGSYVDVSSIGDGSHYGHYVNVGNAGGGDQYGAYTEVNNSGNGTHYGNRMILSGAGTGDKFGNRILVPPSAGGQHFGVYSEALKTGSFAGYFLGNVAVGTNALNTYTLPISRGTNGQIMQTDGSGNVSWVNPTTPTALIDSDANTLVQVEETAGEDIIRFDTNGLERMQIGATGNVGINVSNPSDFLHVKGNIRTEAITDTDYWITNTDASDDYNFYYNSILLSYIRSTDGMFVVFSDKRLKKNIKPISETISEKVLALNPVNYTYTADATETLQHGFIAQEVQKIFPELVDTKHTENGEFLSLNYQAFGVLAIQVIKEQQLELKALKEKVLKIDQLEQRILKLEE